MHTYIFLIFKNFLVVEYFIYTYITGDFTVSFAPRYDRINCGMPEAKEMC